MTMLKRYLKRNSRKSTDFGAMVSGELEDGTKFVIAFPDYVMPDEAMQALLKEQQDEEKEEPKEPLSDFNQKLKTALNYNPKDKK